MNDNHRATVIWDDLTHRETALRISDLEHARLVEIEAYWARCRCSPPPPPIEPENGASIERDLALLAHCPYPAPAAMTFQSLMQAAARLVSLDTVRASLLAETDEEAAQTFWENGAIVAMKSCAGQQVFVVRFDGPCFNPDTLPKNGPDDGPSLHLVHVPSDVRPHSDFETLFAYVFGYVDQCQKWREASPGLQCRSDLLRDLRAMERLVDRACLSDEHWDVPPLLEFSSSSDALIRQLKAHRELLREKGQTPAPQLAKLDQLTAPIHENISVLRKQMQRIQDALFEAGQSIIRIEAAVLEEETGFRCGDRVRHVATNDEGILEIVHHGHAQFRLQGSDWYVTEDIRRGEWIRLPGAIAEP